MKQNPLQRSRLAVRKAVKENRTYLAFSVNFRFWILDQTRRSV